MKVWLGGAVFAVSLGGAAMAADGLLDPLSVAAVRGDSGEVKALIAAGADPDRRGWLGLTPLAAAVRSCRGTPDVIAALIAGGADVEARPTDGATPLMVAWQRSRGDLARVLLAAGADTEARNLYGDTAEEYARFFAGELPADEFASRRYLWLGSSQAGGC